MKRYLKKKLKSLSLEEKMLAIKHLALEDKVAAVRAEVLKAYREQSKGNFLQG